MRVKVEPRQCQRREEEGRRVENPTGIGVSFDGSGRTDADPDPEGSTSRSTTGKGNTNTDYSSNEQKRLEVHITKIKTELDKQVLNRDMQSETGDNLPEMASGSLPLVPIGNDHRFNFKCEICLLGFQEFNQLLQDLQHHATEDLWPINLKARAVLESMKLSFTKIDKSLTHKSTCKCGKQTISGEPVVTISEPQLGLTPAVGAPSEPEIKSELIELDDMPPVLEDGVPESRLQTELLNLSLLPDSEIKTEPIDVLGPTPSFPSTSKLCSKHAEPEEPDDNDGLDNNKDIPGVRNLRKRKPGVDEKPQRSSCRICYEFVSDGELTCFKCQIQNAFSCKVNLERVQQISGLNSRTRSTSIKTGKKPTLISKEQYSCETCGKGFVTKTGLQGHMRNHTGELPYECTFCDQKFKHDAGLKYYMHSIHIPNNKNTCHCDVCDKCFPDATTLKSHSILLAGQKPPPYECIYCSETFAHHAELMNHIITGHVGQVEEYINQEMKMKRTSHPLKIEPQTKASATSSSSLPAKKRTPKRATPSVKQEIMEEIAGPSTRSLPPLRPEEMNLDDSDSSHPYMGMPTLLPMTSEDPDPRVEERQTPNSSPPSKQARKVAEKKPILRRPRPRHHLWTRSIKTKLLNIPNAKKITSRPRKAATEIVSQQLIKARVGRPKKSDEAKEKKTVTSYACEHCEKTFLRAWSLNLHIRFHTGEKPFACTYCGRAFAAKGNWKKHVKMVHEMKGKGKSSTPALALVAAGAAAVSSKSKGNQKPRKPGGRVRKPGPKIHKCNECGKSFEFNSYLARHLRIHSRSMASVG